MALPAVPRLDLTMVTVPPPQGPVASTIAKAKKEVAIPAGWNPQPAIDKDPYENYEILAAQMKTIGGKAHFISEKARFLEVYDKDYPEALKHYSRALKYAQQDPLSTLHKGVKFYKDKVLALSVIVKQKRDDAKR